MKLKFSCVKKKFHFFCFLRETKHTSKTTTHIWNVQKHIWPHSSRWYDITGPLVHYRWMFSHFTPEISEYSMKCCGSPVLGCSCWITGLIPIISIFNLKNCPFNYQTASLGSDYKGSKYLIMTYWILNDTMINIYFCQVETWSWIRMSCTNSLYKWLRPRKTSERGTKHTGNTQTNTQEQHLKYFVQMYPFTNTWEYKRTQRMWNGKESKELDFFFHR